MDLFLKDHLRNDPRDHTPSVGNFAVVGFSNLANELAPIVNSEGVTEPSLLQKTVKASYHNP